eukprot:jgi/Mesen1/10936/ME000095S10268
MKCNSCWRALEERAIATTCTEDASKILSSDSTCPLCEQILSKSNMKAVDLNPSDEWVNMVMAGVPPHSIMKSAFKGVTFWIGQKEVEGQLIVTKAMHLKQKYEEMQVKYMEKLEQTHTAYQKAMKKVQYLEHEKDNLLKDKTELQDKYSEKSRQKRKLEEMYESLRGEYEQLKRGTLGPVNQDSRAIMQRAPQYNFAPTSRAFEEPKMRATPNSLALAPITPVQMSDPWPRPRSASGLFDMPGLPSTRARAGASSPGQGAGFAPERPRTSGGGGGGASSPFRSADPNTMFTPSQGNPSNALRNLLLSPMKRPPSRLRVGVLRR